MRPRRAFGRRLRNVGKSLLRGLEFLGLDFLIHVVVPPLWSSAIPPSTTSAMTKKRTQVRSNSPSSRGVAEDIRRLLSLRPPTLFLSDRGCGATIRSQQKSF